MSLFGEDIAGLISDALNGELLDATLTRTTNSGTYNSQTDTYSGGSTPTTYTTQGIVEQYDISLMQTGDLGKRHKGLIQTNDRKILLLAEPLGVEPSPGDNNQPPDQITIDGKTFTVISVAKDPASATYEVQGRL